MIEKEKPSVLNFGRPTLPKAISRNRSMFGVHTPIV